MKIDISQGVTSPCYEFCYLEHKNPNDNDCTRCKYHLARQILKRLLIETSGCRYCLSAVPAENDRLECVKNCSDTCYHDNSIDINLTDLVKEFCLTEDLNDGIG